MTYCFLNGKENSDMLLQIFLSGNHFRGAEATAENDQWSALIIQGK